MYNPDYPILSGALFKFVAFAMVSALFGWFMQSRRSRKEEEAPAPAGPIPDCSHLSPLEREPAPSCYAVLGVSPRADLDDVKKAYRDLVKRYHPDTASSPEEKAEYHHMCAEINEAYRQIIGRA